MTGIVLFVTLLVFLVLNVPVGIAIGLASLAAITTNPRMTDSFIVSQRAASLQHADQIIVLDDGHMVGLGRHAELLDSCPVYREIYESQFKKGDAQK